MIASLGNSPLSIQKNCYSVATGKIQLNYKENISCVSWQMDYSRKKNQTKGGRGEEVEDMEFPWVLKK